jgi:hypothetical protein
MWQLSNMRMARCGKKFAATQQMAASDGRRPQAPA